MFRFGIYPENETPEMWWGARAIVSRDGIEILRDRQNFEGNREHENLNDFMWWLNNVAIPYVNICVKEKRITKNISIESETGYFHLEADDHNSGGYLYIGAWTNIKSAR